MSSLSWVIDVVEKEVEQKIRTALQSTAQSFKEEIQLARSQMIQTWFDGYNGSRWWAKNQQIVNSSWHASGINGSLSFTSYTTTDGVGSFDSADRWLSTHGGGEPSQEYVSGLIWEQGIIGLPESSTVSDWVNTHFIQKRPLEDYVITNPKWETIAEKLKQNVLKNIN